MSAESVLRSRTSSEITPLQTESSIRLQPKHWPFCNVALTHSSARTTFNRIQDMFFYCEVSKIEKIIPMANAWQVVRRLGSAHSSDSSFVRFSPDGKKLATGGMKVLIKGVRGCWSMSLDHDDISSVAFAPDGRSLAAVSGASSVTLWSTSTGELLRAFQAGEVFCVAFAPGGESLAAAGDGLTLWDVRSGELLRTLSGHSDFVWSVAFSTRGTLASGSDDESVLVWNACSGEATRQLHCHPHSGGIDCVAFSADGALLAASCRCAVVLWNTSTWACTHTVTMCATVSTVSSISISPGVHKRILAAGLNNGQVVIVDVDRNLIAPLGGEGNASSESQTSVAVDFSPCGRFVASRAEDGECLVWAAPGTLLVCALVELMARVEVLSRSSREVVLQEDSAAELQSHTAWIGHICCARMPHGAILIIFRFLLLTDCIEPLVGDLA